MISTLKKKKMRVKRKYNEGKRNRGKEDRGAAIVGKEVRKDFSVMTFEQKSKGRKGVLHSEIWGKRVSDKRKYCTTTVRGLSCPFQGIAESSGVEHAYYPSTQEAEAGGSQAQDLA
jgi:hypothetical protein